MQPAVTAIEADILLRGEKLRRYLKRKKKEKEIKKWKPGPKEEIAVIMGCTKFLYSWSKIQ